MIGVPMVARMRDVAERAGVSVKTVSNVINDYLHVTPATRSKVEAAIAELDYHPSVTARALRYGRVGIVALAVPDLSAPFFAGLAAAVVRAARRQDHAVLIEQTDGDADTERLVLDGLRDRLVDGILFWPVATSATAPTRTVAPDRPVVLLGEGLLGAPGPEALARAAVDILLERISGASPHAGQSRIRAADFTLGT
jgi:DNA-binding LacI/PurR family transcriptional regulator